MKGRKRYKSNSELERLPLCPDCATPLTPVRTNGYEGDGGSTVQKWICPTAVGAVEWDWREHRMPKGDAHRKGVIMYTDWEVKYFKWVEM